jgi:hypothetical protein
VIFYGSYIAGDSIDEVSKNRDSIKEYLATRFVSTLVMALMEQV